RFDRNFLRLSIMPLLKGRWPTLVNRIAHSARACREADELAGKLAELRFRQCATDQGTLDVNALGQLAVTEQKNLVRWWITHNRYLPPSLADWSRVISDLVNAPSDGEPELRGNGYVIRRYRGYLYLVGEPPALPRNKVTLVPGQEQVWGEWRLRLVATADPEMPAPDIRISTRVGGERLRPAPDGPSKTLKNWLQEQHIPPWERARLPLVLEVKDGSEEVVGAGDVWLSGKYCGEAPASGWRIVVERECN
ncbi:MAG: tRNA lysidine(34) synthetase TilS, partial [Marinobacter sp.]|nr:tRNA lysidine(34) synthetase TilS [Marinobacter sp.]